MELTDEQYEAFINSNYSFMEKVRGFFYHVYMLAFAPHDAKRAAYVDVFEAYERRANSDKEN